VTISAGTDAGNIGTIHGSRAIREFQLMKEAGLTRCRFQMRDSQRRETFRGDTGARVGKLENAVSPIL